MKTYKVTIDFKVSQDWIDDGFNLLEDARKEQIRQFFEEEIIPYAHAGIETKAKVKVKSL